MIIHEALHYWNNDPYEQSRLGFCKVESLDLFMKYIVEKTPTIVEDTIKISQTEKGNILIEFKEWDKCRPLDKRTEDDIVDSSIVIRSVEVFEGC